MSTIVFVMLPETGHINASLKLAKSLKARGHRVCYLGLPHSGAVFEENGLEFIALFEQEFAHGPASLEAIKKSNLEILTGLQSLLDARNTNGTLIELLKREMGKAVQRIRPDLFIVDVVFPAIALASAQAGLRTVLLNSMLLNPLLVGETTNGGNRTEATSAVLTLPELVLCPKEFDFPQSDESRRPLHYIEASIDLERKDPPFPWDRIDRNRPLLYCALGSESRLYSESKQLLQMVMDAISTVPNWQLIVSLGAHLRPHDFGTIPSNAILVATAPQLEVLKSASLMINHAGLNTIKECIFFDVPMIVFPFINDQPANAARVEYHGLGIRGDWQKTSAEQIRSFIERIDRSPSFRLRVEAMGRKFRELESAGQGARIVESILSTPYSAL
jgi:UDP:flavonoid glycosyltransferase YjiC (YdhE family)